MKKEYEKRIDKTIKEWCEIFGIKIIKPNGFKEKKSKVWNKLYTKREFEKGIKRSYISIKTEKGLAFYEAI